MIACKYLVFLALIAVAYAQEEPDDSVCGAEAIDDYNKPLRIGSLFIILVTSAVGVFTPMALYRTFNYQKGGAREWVLLIAKFFGTGVILATAFVHMLPDALEQFSSPCLSPGWQSYGAFAGVFCMLASFFLQLLELLAASRAERMSQQPEAGRESDLEKTSSDTTHMSHGHSAGFLEQEQTFHNIGTLILELGIVMHSVIIGITLATTGEDEFTTLLIALVFHQFFEGVALGTRINEMNHKSWTKPIILGVSYIIMTPIGIAIGIGIHSSFNPNSSSSILSSAILDSLSAGILLYNAYVSLMSMEINHNTMFKRASLLRKTVCMLSMYVGAGLMALIGKWA